MKRIALQGHGEIFWSQDHATRVPTQQELSSAESRNSRTPHPVTSGSQPAKTTASVGFFSVRSWSIDGDAGTGRRSLDLL
jgi:hypothetical protein